MKLFRISLLMLVSLFVTMQALALSTDRDQPAEIEADDIEFDFNKGIRTYIDNVLVVQGSLRIKADKVIMMYANDELETATAWGNLARFKQRPDDKDADTEGWAQKIIVDQKQNTLTLIGKAALKQGPNTARGETIIYNMANDTMRLKGAAKVGAAGKDGQAVPPRAIEDPFKDNSQGPPAIGKVKPKKKPVPGPDSESPDSESPDSEDTDTKTTDTEAPAEEVAEEQQAPAEPVRSGRSRLIIQPK